MTELKTLLQPISSLVAELDAADPKAAERALNERFPADSDPIQKLRAAAVAAAQAGEICDRGEPGMKFSRVAKPDASTGSCSIDAVWMKDAAGPAHTHTNGEFCLCLPTSGQPTFEDRSDLWIVMPKGSRHVPTVKNGEMLILYWLPEGAVVWG